jgi:hypothetical protein
MKLLALTLTTLAFAAPASAQTLFLDAVTTHAAGGDERGVLRDARGVAVGHFALACARGRCHGWGQTTDGRIHFAGPIDTSVPTHTWAIGAASGRYRGAHGTLFARDITDREALMTVTIAPRGGAALRAGVLRLAAANRSFRPRADALCASAARQLDALPPFPFSNFDPRHPDPALLPAVGRFFTGPHDPRPIFRALDAHLRALGTPPAQRAQWSEVLAARADTLIVDDEQDRAALAGDVAGFVKSLGDVRRTYRAMAIGATVFGVSRCVI